MPGLEPLLQSIIDDKILLSIKAENSVLCHSDRDKLAGIIISHLIDGNQMK